MRIQIGNPREAAAEGGMEVEVIHGLNDHGRVTTLYKTHNVIQIGIEGYGCLEIDLSRDDEESRVQFSPESAKR